MNDKVLVLPVAHFHPKRQFDEGQDEEIAKLPIVPTSTRSN
jgi:hypothetical protein